MPLAYAGVPDTLDAFPPETRRRMYLTRPRSLPRSPGPTGCAPYPVVAYAAAATHLHGGEAFLP
jgi:hypothetical protein